MVDGAIGEVRHFDLHQMMNFGSFGPNHTWWNEKEKGGGIIGAAGVHMIDQLHFISGQKISQINAITETFVKEKRMHPKDWKTKADETTMLPCTAEEYVSGQFRCDGGAVGTLTMTGVMTGQGGGQVIFNGTTGSATLADGFTLYDAKGNVVSEVKDERLSDDLRAAAGNHAGAPALGTYNLAVCIREYLAEGKKDALDLACSFEDGLYNQQVIGAIHDSNDSFETARL